jgi:gas vesicle protein
MSDERVESNESQSPAGSNAGSNIAWFLTGAFIGAAAAVLYAPQSGKDTRKYITDKTQQSREKVESASQDIVDAGKDMFERGRKLVDDAAELFDRGRKLVKG